MLTSSLTDILVDSSTSQVLYELHIGVIKTYNPYTHVYGIWTNPSPDDTKINAVPLGALGNSASGVQAAFSYNINDQVLYLSQANPMSAAGGSLAIIIGAAPRDPIVTSKVSDQVIPSMWDFIDNLNAETIDLWRRYEILKKSAIDTPITMLGHGSSDMLPGDYELSSRLMNFIMGDYTVGLKGPCAEILLSGLDRRLEINSMLRTESTINSAKDIAIVGNTTIETAKYCGNVKDAWYNLLEEPGTEKGLSKLFPREGADVARYKVIEQSGDLLYGTHKTVLSDDGKVPLYYEYLGNDGTRTLLSASRLTIGKVPQLKVKQYIGKRLNVSEQPKDYKPTPEKIGDPVSTLNTSNSADWLINDDAFLAGFNEYPDEYVDPSLPGYKDNEAQEVKDQYLDEIKIHPGMGRIDFLEDGGIKIKDAWGSYILMSHGNIEFHARNNIFGVAARDMLTFCGGTHVSYAGENIELQAKNGNIKQLAGKTWHAQSETGRTVLEATKNIEILSKNVDIDALNVVVTCRDPRFDVLTGGGSFRVVAYQGEISMTGDVSRIVGEKASAIISKNAGLVVDQSVACAGNFLVHGGIHCNSDQTTVVAINSKGEEDTYQLDPGLWPDIVNENGGLHVDGIIRTTDQVLALGDVFGRYFYTLIDPGEGKLYKASSVSSIEFTVTDFALGTNVDIVVDATGDTAKQLSDISFSFTLASQSCAYRLEDRLPETGKTFDNNGYLDKKGKTTYIYPGTEFWRSKGLSDHSGTTIKTRGFNSVSIATPNGVERTN